MNLQPVAYLLLAIVAGVFPSTASGAKEFVYEKHLANGQTLTVSREKVPPDPALVSEAKNYPNMAVNDYGQTYSFEVSQEGKKTKKLLWTLTLPHYRQDTDYSPSNMFVLDADLQPEGLIVVYNVLATSYADVIRPDAKGVWVSLPRNGRLSEPRSIDGDAVDAAKISGRLADGTLTVDLTRRWGAYHHVFHFVKDTWVPVPAPKPVPTAQEDTPSNPAK